MIGLFYFVKNCLKAYALTLFFKGVSMLPKKVPLSRRLRIEKGVKAYPLRQFNKKKIRIKIINNNIYIYINVYEDYIMIC